MKIMFVCLGNICRSPMAEYIFDSIDKNNKFDVYSSGLSNEEYGNDIYPPAKDILYKNNITIDNHFAHKITKEEFDSADYVVVMEEYHIERLKIMFGESDKVIKLLDKDIEDPWYTGNFEKVYNEIYEGCLKIYNKIG